MSDTRTNGEGIAKPLRRRDFLRGTTVGAGATVVVGGLIGAAAEHFCSNVSIKKTGFSRARSIPSDGALPAKVDVVVIGGGFVGTSTALALAERGISVALFEKGVVAGEASGRSGGLIGCCLEAADKMEFIEFSKQRWRSMREITGEESGLVENGNTMLFEKEDDLAFADQWLKSVKGSPNGDARMLSAREANGWANGLTKRLAGGLTVPKDMEAEPALAAPGFALGARKKGARIYQFCAVRGIERTGGRVSAVITERGRVATSSVVIAGGVWSTMLGHDLGLDVPLIQCFAKAISLNPFSGPNDGSVSVIGESHPLGWRRQYDGGYIAWELEGWSPALPIWFSRMRSLIPAIKANSDDLEPRFNFDTFRRWWPRSNPVPLDRPGPYEETRIYESEPPYEAIDQGFLRLQKLMPVFKTAAVRERWGGVMQLSIDNRPIISAVDTIPGLFIGTGMFFGMTQGPGAGALLADLVTGQRPPIDVRPFRLSRFVDGSPIRYDF